MSVFCSNNPFSVKDIDNLCGIVYIVIIERKKLPKDTLMDKNALIYVMKSIFYHFNPHYFNCFSLFCKKSAIL